MNDYESKIQNKEILGEVSCKSQAKGCGGGCAGCGNRERVPTIWYIGFAVAIVLSAILLKAIGLI